jgi:hypothetical protein
LRGRRQTIAIALIVSATFAVTAMASAADDPALQGYVGQVEPICQANTEASHHILAGAQARVNRGKLDLAGKQFGRAATAFGKSIEQLEAVPRPPAYEVKLTKWFGHLELIDAYLGKISKALISGNKLKATYEVVKLRSSANATNNVVYDIDFRYCRLTESRFK